jgi:Nucleotidyl transferase AbiEii toxin, Type IV TA system
VTEPHVAAFYREVAQVALAVAAKHGFALGGGLAWVIRGMVARPTEDVDLFACVGGAAAAAADDVRAALLHAGFEVQDLAHSADLAGLFDGFDLDMREFTVQRQGLSLSLTLGCLDRRHSPAVLDIGPTLHPDDLVASKISALINRREVRDYIDAAAALRRYTLDQMLALAHRHDPGLDPADVLEVGRYLDRLPDVRFRRYGLDAGQVAALRQTLAAWPREDMRSPDPESRASSPS